MTATKRSLLLVLPLVAACCSPFALATTVYKTVDANGAVAYSDTSPEQGELVEIVVIEAPAPQLSGEEEARLEALRETTDRMAADRREREQHRAELRKARNQVPAPAAGPANAPGYAGAYPAYYPAYYGYRPHARRGYGQRKLANPVTHPPLRPVAPRSDYPASLIRRHYNPEVRAAFEK